MNVAWIFFYVFLFFSVFRHNTNKCWIIIPCWPYYLLFPVCIKHGTIDFGISWKFKRWWEVYSFDHVWHRLLSLQMLSSLIRNSVLYALGLAITLSLVGLSAALVGQVSMNLISCHALFLYMNTFIIRYTVLLLVNHPLIYYQILEQVIFSSFKVLTLYLSIHPFNRNISYSNGT